MIDDIRQSGKNFSALVYFVSTFFMVFFSVHAIQQWPPYLARVTIASACILPILLVFMENRLTLAQWGKWPVEIKFVLIIVFLGTLNICFSENPSASLKGMSLFLFSGILIFGVSFFVFHSEQTQKSFIYLCALFFICLMVYGFFECFKNINTPGQNIFLFSANPIPAGSLFILLSIGPLTLLAKSKNNWQRFFWILSLLLGVSLITLIGQRGPVIAITIMVFFLTATKRKGIWVFTLTALLLTGIGQQLSEKIPTEIKANLLKKETLLVRLEFYHVALDVLREKPIFGVGFNSSISRFIPRDYKTKVYPDDKKVSFYQMTLGVNVFDNMALSLLGETGSLFTVIYFAFGLYIFKVLLTSRKSKMYDKTQTFLILIVLAGFLSQSMIYDSLKNPHLNWIFHSILGLIARRQAPNQRDQVNQS